MGEKKHLLSLLILLSVPSVAPSGSGRNYTNSEAPAVSWLSSTQEPVCCYSCVFFCSRIAHSEQTQDTANRLLQLETLVGPSRSRFAAVRTSYVIFIIPDCICFNLFKNNKTNVCFSLWVQSSRDQQVTSSRLRPPSNRWFLKLLFFICVLAFYPNSNYFSWKNSGSCVDAKIRELGWRWRHEMHNSSSTWQIYTQ